MYISTTTTYLGIAPPLKAFMYTSSTTTTTTTTTTTATTTTTDTTSTIPPSTTGHQTRPADDPTTTGAEEETTTGAEEETTTATEEETTTAAGEETTTAPEEETTTDPGEETTTDEETTLAPIDCPEGWIDATSDGLGCLLFVEADDGINWLATQTICQSGDGYSVEALDMAEVVTIGPS